MPFPRDFLWGSATSSYQIEGTADAGPSIFDPFCRRPGAVFQSHSGEVACDHYRKFRDDVALMREIGLRAYRFSISWPRVMPEGAGAVSEKGLGFYDALVDALLEAGIQPWVTLFHWDFPLALHHRGGWFNRDSASWFGDYAAVVVDRLSDRVRHWMTLNEPQVFIKFGFGDGTLAPGFKLGLGEQVRACHNALRAHGRGAQVIRARAKSAPSVGWAVVGRVDYPESSEPGEADIEAARRGMMGITEPSLWNNTWYGDPVVYGAYPEDALEVFGPDARPPVEPGDMDLIKQPLDYYGLNIYDGRPVRPRADGSGKPEVVPFAPGHPQTAFRWYITPPCLRWGPRLIYERYKVPVYITENGMSGIDWVGTDGAVHDPQRIDYTARYLRELRRAIDDGADVRGYFHWSLMDNFEWAAGYRERFGLIHVDFATQRRTLKDSARWYGRVIESNGGALDGG